VYIYIYDIPMPSLYPSQKRTTRHKLRYAVKRGLINKPKKCSDCKEEKALQGHHPDYSKPLEVIWLCRKCHDSLHRIERLKNKPLIVKTKIVMKVKKPEIKKLEKWEISKKMTELGKIGGKNRAKKLSKKRRKEIARLGGLARVSKLKQEQNDSN
jgi:hypothetical protein